MSQARTLWADCAPSLPSPIVAESPKTGSRRCRSTVVSTWQVETDAACVVGLHTPDTRRAAYVYTQRLSRSELAVARPQVVLFHL